MGAMINNVNVRSASKEKNVNARSASVCCCRLHNISYIYVQTFHLFLLIVFQVNTNHAKISFAVETMFLVYIPHNNYIILYLINT